MPKAETKVERIDDGKVYMFEESRTIQASADEVDINTLVARAKNGADLSSYMRPGQYEDVSEIPRDLREALAIVNQANELFYGLDANIRERFKNDPAQMIDFLGDPKNREEAISLGMVKAPEVDETLDTLKSIDSSLKASSDAKKGKAKPAPDEA